MALRLSYLLFMVVLSFSTGAQTDLVMVASPKAGIERLTHEDVVNIYLGRYRGLASGLIAEPLDYPAGSETRAAFYRKLVGKTQSEINAYWARLVFSGKARPPGIVKTPDDAYQVVIERPGALAYVERSRVDKQVAIVYVIGE